MTTESERKKVEADLNILLAKVEGGTEGSKSQTLKREKERTWKVNVEFYPLSDYEKKEVPIVAPLVNDTLTANGTIPQKRLNVTWIMGAIIIVLLAILLGMLLL